jgi:hypothetical protein
MQEYRRTHIMLNIYCFSTAMIVTRTRLNVTLYVHCLSCSWPCVCCHGYSLYVQYLMHFYFTVERGSGPWLRGILFLYTWSYFSFVLSCPTLIYYGKTKLLMSPFVCGCVRFIFQFSAGWYVLMKFCMDVLLLKSTPTISCSRMTDERAFEVEQTLAALHFGSWTSYVYKGVSKSSETGPID